MSHCETLQAPKKAKKRAEGGSSNVFSMFEQTQIQEFKEVCSVAHWLTAVWSLLITMTHKLTSATCPQAFTIMDQNRDGFIDKNDLRDTFAALGNTCAS